MGIFIFKQFFQSKWLLQKNKLSKVLLTRFGTLMMPISPVLSTSKRLRNSFKIPLVTSDLVTSSVMKLSMRSSLPSTKTTPELLRKTRWSYSSSNSSEETEYRVGDDAPNTAGRRIKKDLPQCGNQPDASTKL